MDALFHGGSNDTISGCVRFRQPEISPFCPFQLSPIICCSSPCGNIEQNPASVNNCFYSGDVVTMQWTISIVTLDNLICDTGDICSPVSLSPAINLSQVSTTPAITENPGQGLIAGVIDTDDKHSFSNISANFRKNRKRAAMEYSGARGALIHEKKLKSKISCQTPFKKK